MIPENKLSLQPVRGKYKNPSGAFLKSTQDRELGGIAIQDTSQGLQYQVWAVEWSAVSEEVTLKAETTGDTSVLMTVSDVKEISLTFDQNMRWQLAILDTSNQLKHFWYDAVAAGYVTTTYLNIASAKIRLDDKRPLQLRLDNSDVILTYLNLSGNLCWRTQRDRYATETIGSTGLRTDLRISNFGMTEINRLQWRLSYRRT